MNLSPNPPDRPFVRYPGSKTRLAKWIVSWFPNFHDTYIETHGGSAATLFAKERSHIETYNDINGDLVQLFRTMRERPEELIRAIMLTPWAAEELRTVCEPSSDPIERARRFYVRLWMSRYPFDANPSFRRQKIFSRGRNGRSSMRAAARAFTDVEHLFDVAMRLRGVQIEQMDACDLIERYDYGRALFYVDPPYLFSERARTAHYAHEADTAEHERLARALNGIEGMAVLSGYASDLYMDLYEARGWSRVDRSARVDGDGKRVESLWLNVATQEKLTLERRRLL